MPNDIPMTEDGLRRAMRDERYWKSSHPERPGYVGWVTEGWAALSTSPARTAEGKATVFVRAYDRSRGGKKHHVDAHTRSGPPGNDGPDAVMRAASLPGVAPVPPPVAKGGEARVTPVQLAPFLLAPKPPGYVVPRPPTGPGAPAGTPMRRVPNQSGKEAASDIPSWARGVPRMRGQTPRDYADKIMRNKYGERWRDGAGSQMEREFKQIRKFGERGFMDEFLGIHDISGEGKEA